MKKRKAAQTALPWGGLTSFPAQEAWEYAVDRALARVEMLLPEKPPQVLIDDNVFELLPRTEAVITDIIEEFFEVLTDALVHEDFLGELSVFAEFEGVIHDLRVVEENGTSRFIIVHRGLTQRADD